MTEVRPQARRRVLTIVLFAGVLLAAAQVLILISSRGGVPSIDIRLSLEGNQAVVRFRNRGARAGYECGWVNAVCAGKKTTTHLCSDQVGPGVTREKRVPIPDSGCVVSWIVDDGPIP